MAAISASGGQDVAMGEYVEGRTLKKEEQNDYRIRKVVFKMLGNRGYNIASEDANLSREEFTRQFLDVPSAEGDSRERMTIQVQQVDDVNDQIFVFFPDDPKLGVDPIRSYIDRMKENGATRGIIVVKNNVTPLAKAAIEELRPDYNIEIFNRLELLVDITEHELVPEHVVLTDAEKQQLLDRYTLKETQLPRLQKGDPVARYFGLDRGQVVKIIRPSETAGRYVTYRIVW